MFQEEAISTEAVLEGDASTPKKEPEPKPVEAAASTVVSAQNRNNTSAKAFLCEMPHVSE